MLGTIYEWFYEAVLGLKPETEAYRTWTVKPPLKSEFKHVAGSVTCPYGDIIIEFDRRVYDAIKMKIIVPTSTTGFLLLPKDDSEVEVMRASRQGAQSDVILEKGKRVCLKPGKYELSLRP